MHRVFVVRFHAIGQVSFSRREIYLWQMFGALLSAQDEGESEDGHAVFGSADAFAWSWFGAASCV
jgi:hypothetical protein